MYCCGSDVGRGGFRLCLCRRVALTLKLYELRFENVKRAGNTSNGGGEIRSSADKGHGTRHLSQRCAGLTYHTADCCKTTLRPSRLKGDDSHPMLPAAASACVILSCDPATLPLHTTKSRKSTLHLCDLNRIVVQINGSATPPAARCKGQRLGFRSSRPPTAINTPIIPPPLPPPHHALHNPAICP